MKKGWQGGKLILWFLFWVVVVGGGGVVVVVVVLINSVLHALPTCDVLISLNKVEKRLDKLRMDFLWKGKR